MKQYSRRRWSEDLGSPEVGSVGECQECDKKEECECTECAKKDITEADKTMCATRGQDYSAGADMCHRPCEKGHRFKANPTGGGGKCIPHVEN